MCISTDDGGNLPWSPRDPGIGDIVTPVDTQTWHGRNWYRLFGYPLLYGVECFAVLGGLVEEEIAVEKEFSK